MNPRLCVWAALLALWSAPSWSRGCGEGAIWGGIGTEGDPHVIRQCVLTGRIYCRLGEYRSAGLQKDAAVARTSEWLSGLNQTGSNVRRNWKPLVEIAARDAYGPSKKVPGTLFYRAIYSCGAALRSQASPARKGGLLSAFDKLANRCEGANPPPDSDGYPNENLRACLLQALDNAAGAASGR